MDWNVLLIGAFIGAIIGIPFSIFANIATPWIQSYFKQKSLSFPERRLYLLYGRYRYIKLLRGNHGIFTAEMFRLLSFVLASILSVIALLSLVIFMTVTSTNKDVSWGMNLFQTFMLFMYVTTPFIGLTNMGDVARDVVRFA